HLFTLDLVQPTPDPMGFSDPDRVVEAVRTHPALGANRLGPGLPSQLLLLALRVRRRKERLGLRTPTRGARLPGLRTLTHTPPPNPLPLEPQGSSAPLRPTRGLTRTSLRSQAESRIARTTLACAWTSP